MSRLQRFTGKQPKMSSFYESLSKEDKRTVDGWAEKARNSQYKRDIPYELYIKAQLGYFYGWDAMMAFARGYEIGIDDDGKYIKLPYTFEDAVADVKAAEKVHYRYAMENADFNALSGSSIQDKEYGKTVANWANEKRKEL